MLSNSGFRYQGLGSGVEVQCFMLQGVGLGSTWVKVHRVYCQAMGFRVEWGSSLGDHKNAILTP